MEPLDLIIVGAGWSGLTMAKTYHEIHPNHTIRILDSATSIGGSWSAERIYGGLKTNNVVGSYEFSDFPMDLRLVNTRAGQHIPGIGVHRYLCAAGKAFDLERFLVLGRKVEGVELRDDDLWKVKCEGGETMVAKKLVLATGLTSEFFMPTFEGQENFRGHLIHSRQLKACSEVLSRAKDVLVVGGNKSAWDVCYAVASAVGKAYMVIRPSGGGPSWVWPKSFKLLGLWQTSLPKLSITRFWSLFDPWPFGVEDRFEKYAKDFLHRSILGRVVTNIFWKILGEHVLLANGYAKQACTKMLKPWSSAFWMGNSLSTHNYPSSWFDLVREGKIIIHHAEVTSLGENSATLSNGKVQEVDAIVCCTGWKATPPLRFYPREIEHFIGLPKVEDSIDVKAASKAQQEILNLCPSLRSTQFSEQSKTRTIFSPYRLHRFVTPSTEKFLKSKNLAYISLDFSLHTVILAQVQALWITAFFSNRIPHLTEENLNTSQVMLDTFFLSEYETLRRPRRTGGCGEKFADLVFDSLPYVDMLLRDLGLETRRKGSWWKELFEPYGLRDYRGLVEEWKRRVE